VTTATQYTKIALGFVFDRNLVVEEEKHSGVLVHKRSISFPTDRSGHVVSAFYVDNLWIPILAFYFILLEWRFGRTLGKALTSVRVRSLSAATPSLLQAAKRFILRFLPLIVYQTYFVVPAIALVLVSSATALVLSSCLVLVLSLAILINFIRAVRRGELPWHDRFAATEMVPAE
jgi:uncharacterized RDD family membrane protein YckC